MKIIRNHPFVIYGLITLGIQAALSLSGAEYDNGGITGLLILTSSVWGVIYWAPSEFLFTYFSGIGKTEHILISIVSGIFCCVVLDMLFNSYRSKINK